MADRVLMCSDDVSYVIYPHGKNERDTVLITKADLLRLQPKEFFNDSLIDFYLKFIWMEDKPGGPTSPLPPLMPISLRREIHIFNTFFYTQWRTTTTKDKSVDLIALKYNAVRIHTTQLLLTRVQSMTRWYSL